MPQATSPATKRQKLGEGTLTAPAKAQAAPQHATESCSEKPAVPPENSPSAAADSLTQQALHTPLLAQCSVQDLCSALTEKTCYVSSGWRPEYCRWWQKQAPQNSKQSLFPAQLIGDASRPDLHTSMTFADLAFCSKWGQKLVDDRNDRTPFLRAVFPVLTAPEIVQEAVAGMLGSYVKLSASNIEPILVLANAVGFESLETACVDYLINAANRMPPAMLLCVISLAERLGLHGLPDKLAVELVRRPWNRNMDSLACIVQHLYETKRDIKAFLHTPSRGALSELEVLEILEAADISNIDISAIMEVELMGPAKINILLAILVEKTHADITPLLRKAVRQHLQGATADAHTNFYAVKRRIVEGVMMPTVDQSNVYIPLLDSELKLSLAWQTTEGVDHGGHAGIFLAPQDPEKNLLQCVTYFGFFALDAKKPYLKQSRELFDLDISNPEPGQGYGFSKYLQDLAKHYTTDYKGPFTIGVCWGPPDTDSSNPESGSASD